MRSWLLSVLVGLLGLLTSPGAQAYSVEPGNVLVRAVTGASLNVLRLDAATRETPGAGMLVGVDVDYSIDGAWNLAAAIRPVLAPGFVDTWVGVGGKYRVVQLEAPFIPYASGLVTAALGTPLGFGDIHTNVGLRMAFGVDYFVMRHLALGLEVGAEVSELLTPLLVPEATTEILAGVSWRF